MIDDDEEDFIILRDIVSEINHHKYTIEWVSSYKEGLTRLLEQKHDVYLIDLFLGTNTGIDLIVEAIKSNCYKPLIILTGQRDYMADNTAMEAGATDYLIKGEITSKSQKNASLFEYVAIIYINLFFHQLLSTKLLVR